MKTYDLVAHLPGQVEHFFNGYASNDLGLIERSFSNIKDIIQNTKFHKDLIDYELKLRENIRGIEKTALDALQNGSKVVSLDDAIQVMNQAATQSTMVNNEYLETIKTYVTGYIDKMSVASDLDQDG